MGEVLFFAAIFGRCTTRLSQKVDVQVMVERANCFGALKTLRFCCFLVAILFLVILSANANANMLSASR